MLVFGRITKDAVVTDLKDGRQVVNFAIAVNDWYKPKNGEARKFTLYVNCAYWISTKIAGRLTKGALVEVNGRLFLNCYNDMKGEPRPTLNCHVNTIKIHSSSKKDESPISTVAADTQQPSADDLPF